MAENFQIPYIRMPVTSLGANQDKVFPISVNYFLFEKISDDSGSDLDPLLTVEIENNLQYKIPALYKVNFNNAATPREDLFQKRIRVINHNAFPVTFVAAGGMGDVTSERSQVVGGVDVIQDWAAALNITLQDSSGSGANANLQSTNPVTSGVTVYDIIQASNDNKRIIFCTIVETSGKPDALIELSANSSGASGIGSYLVCPPGQVASLPTPIYTNGIAGKIVVVYRNGATGYAYGMWEGEPVTASGAAP